MPYEYEIYDFLKNEKKHAIIKDESRPNALNKIARLYVNNLRIGSIIYFYAKDHLEIQMLKNEKLNNYANVGTMLFYYVLQESLKNKGGNIILQPVLNSNEFWKKLGFKFDPNKPGNMFLPEHVIKQYREYFNQVPEPKPPKP